MYRIVVNYNTVRCNTQTSLGGQSWRSNVIPSEGTWVCKFSIVFPLLCVYFLGQHRRRRMNAWPWLIISFQGVYFIACSDFLGFLKGDDNYVKPGRRNIKQLTISRSPLFMERKFNQEIRIRMAKCRSFIS